MSNFESGPVSLKRRHLTLSLPLLACGLVVAPVQANSDIYQSSSLLMGTRIDLTLQGASPQVMASAAKAALTEMTRLVDMMSRYRNDSALNAINLAAGVQPVRVPPELMRVLKMAQAAAQASHGAFDATIGALRDWSFDSAHPVIATPEQIASQLPLVGAMGLSLNERQSTAFLRKRGMRLDLGGIAKLPIMQAGMQQLLAHGVDNAMINGGGDVMVQGQLNGRDWRIGLRDPRRPDRLLGVIGLNKGFVASSGDYERFIINNGKRLHHILDPKTGYPSQGTRGVVLISERLEALNGLGAAIMVAGTQFGRARIRSLAGMDGLIVDADNQLWTSSGMSKRWLPS